MVLDACTSTGKRKNSKEKQSPWHVINTVSGFLVKLVVCIQCHPTVPSWSSSMSKPTDDHLGAALRKLETRITLASDDSSYLPRVSRLLRVEHVSLSSLPIWTCLKKRQLPAKHLKLQERLMFITWIFEGTNHISSGRFYIRKEQLAAGVTSKNFSFEPSQSATKALQRSKTKNTKKKETRCWHGVDIVEVAIQTKLVWNVWENR